MSALNSAVKRKLLAHNPALHVELPHARRPKAVVWTAGRIEAWQLTGARPAVAVWTPEQAGTFLDAAAEDRLYPLFHLIAYRGLRRGEAVGVRWEDLDLDAASLTVTQQVVQVGWETEIGEPKTDSGARIISLDDATLTVLRARHRGTKPTSGGPPGNARGSSSLARTAQGSTRRPSRTPSSRSPRLPDCRRSGYMIFDTQRPALRY